MTNILNPAHIRSLAGARLARLALLIGVMLVMAGIALAQEGPLYALPRVRAYSSSTMALTLGGRTLVVTNMLNDTVSITEPLNNTLVAEIPVGKDPRSVAITPDDSHAYIVNHGDGTLSVLDIADQAITASYPLGPQPFAIVAGDNNTAYVTLEGSSEVVRVDLATGAITARIAVPADPAGLALWGDFLYVTHLWSGDFSLIYLPDLRVVDTISTGSQTGMSPSVTIDTQRGLAYLPQSIYNTTPRDLTYDNTIMPIVNVVDLSTMRVLRDSRIALDVVDRPVNMPFAVTLDPLRRYLYVANAGSNDVSVVDLVSGKAVAHLPVDSNPRGIITNRDDSYVYVHNAIDGTVSLLETRRQIEYNKVLVSDLHIPVDLLIGAQLFYSATDPRLSTNDYISCASCHFDGQPDGRSWPLPGGEVRSTPPLYDLENTGPYGWDGNWDELADVEVHARAVQTGTGLVDGVAFTTFADVHAGASPDLDILVNYLNTLQGPANPTAGDPDQIARGKAIFDAQNCDSCHSGTDFTDGQSHDVGTGGSFNTPTLRWLWMSAPYFHDGSAATLREVFTRSGEHRLIVDLSEADISDLVAYLLSLP